MLAYIALMPQRIVLKSSHQMSLNEDLHSLTLCLPICINEYVKWNLIKDVL
jgi:hypothetical protein